TDRRSPAAAADRPRIVPVAPRAICPSWKPARSSCGGRAAAILFSVASTCRDLGIDPFAYLQDVLDSLSTRPAGRVEEFASRPLQEAPPRRRSAVAGREPRRVAGRTVRPWPCTQGCAGRRMATE